MKFKLRLNEIVLFFVILTVSILVASLVQYSVVRESPYSKLGSLISSNDWIGYWGSVFGALIAAYATILAVKASIRAQQADLNRTLTLQEKQFAAQYQQQEEKDKKSVRPFLSIKSHDFRDLDEGLEKIIIYKTGGSLSSFSNKIIERVESIAAESKNDSIRLLVKNIGIGSLLSCTFKSDLIKPLPDRQGHLDLAVNESMIVILPVQKPDSFPEDGIRSIIEVEYEDILGTCYGSRIELQLNYFENRDQIYVGGIKYSRPVEIGKKQ